MLISWLNLVASIRLWRQRARTRKLLATLNDRMLDDIGLSPCDVSREVSKPFWRA